MNKGLTIRKIIIWSILYVVGKGFSEFHSLVFLKHPELKEHPVYLYLFISKDCEDCEAVDVLWYLKMIGDNMDKAMDAFIMIRMALAFGAYNKELSRVLFKITCLILAYRLADLLLFIYNFNSTAWMYWVMIGVISLGTWNIIIHRNKMRIV